jgi:hypothetical protein
MNPQNHGIALLQIPVLTLFIKKTYARADPDPNNTVPEGKRCASAESIPCRSYWHRRKTFRLQQCNLAILGIRTAEKQQPPGIILEVSTGQNSIRRQSMDGKRNRFDLCKSTR